MDISDTLAPTSDQLDAVDLLSGPRTFTIERASKGNAEQPVQIHLAEFPRVWRPGKSMRRVLVAAWGADASTYAGRRVTLYCDPDVKFGGDKVGGTRISHMTDLPDGKPLSVPLLVSRGKSAMFTVQPLTEAAAPKAANTDYAALVDGATTEAELKAAWDQAKAEGAGTDELSQAIARKLNILRDPQEQDTDVTEADLAQQEIGGEG